MNRNTAILTLVLLALVVAFAPAPSTGQGLTDAALGKPTPALSRIYPFQSAVGATHSVATVAAAISAVPGRSRIVLYTAGPHEIHVDFVASVAVTTGFRLSFDRPLTFDVDDGVAIYAISSGTYAMHSVQFSY